MSGTGSKDPQRKMWEERKDSPSQGYTIRQMLLQDLETAKYWLENGLIWMVMWALLSFCVQASIDQGSREYLGNWISGCELKNTGQERMA